MAATARRRCKYNVFLSFRGKDTRQGFVSHLYKKLTDKGIYAYKDDRKLPKGRSISPEITEAIRDSTLYVVVLSANYASSPWCLEELWEIAEQARSRERRAVVPVFYNVDPSDVEEVRGRFAAAIADHAPSFGEETVRKWKDALTYVSGICGWDSRNREEADLISDIVRDVSDKVNSAFSSDTSYLVGIGDGVKRMQQLLNVDSDAVRIGGIWGMEGAGKSTLARVIYDELRPKFGACCFISDVGSKFSEKNGYVALQIELLSAILNEKEKDIRRWPLHKGSSIIKERLCRKNILIVLHNVDHRQQLQLLAKERNWFGPGSRIIVTTRDKDVLNTHNVDFVYEVEPLPEDAALQLFSKWAFKQNRPKEGYLELSREFVSHAGGIPFALELLGSSQSNKSVTEWKRELDKLKKVPHWRIIEMLKVSIDGLEEKEKDVFLDIACFFNKMDKDRVGAVLDACGAFPESAFEVLMNKALIRTPYGQLHMHEWHKKLGQNIVRQESHDLGERSRWWEPNDIYRCLTKNRGSKKVQGIFLDMSKATEMNLASDAFTKMEELRLFNFYDSQSDEPTCNMKLQGDCLGSISQELRYFRWDAFPARVLPSDFCAEYLVELHMPNSNIEVLWEGKQRLMNLKVIDLRCSNLIKLPDLSEAKKLEDLNLRGCSNLVRLPSLACLEVLTKLQLTDCSKLQRLPPMPSNCKDIYLSGTAIKRLPPSCKYFSGVKVLDMGGCKMLTDLENISELECFDQVNVAGCPKYLQVLSEDRIEGSPTKCLSGQSTYDRSVDIVPNGTLVLIQTCLLLQFEVCNYTLIYAVDVDNDLLEQADEAKMLPKSLLTSSTSGDEEGKWKNFQPEIVHVEDKKRKWFFVANEPIVSSETKPFFESDSSYKYECFINSDASSDVVPSSSCTQKGFGAGARVFTLAKDSSGFSNPARNGFLPPQRPISNGSCSSRMQTVPEESNNNVLQDLKSILDQCPDIKAFEIIRQQMKRLAKNARISVEDKNKLVELELGMSSIQRNCEAIEIQELDKEIADAEARLKSANTSPEEAEHQVNSTTTKPQVVNAEVPFFSDGVQKIMDSMLVEGGAVIN